jgi:hypothetical protein
LIEGRKIDYCKRWAEESKGEAIWKKEEGYGRKRKKEIERKEDGGDGGARRWAIEEEEKGCEIERQYLRQEGRERQEIAYLF